MAARPSLAREEARDGYVLGDRTWDHPDLVLLSAVVGRQPGLDADGSGSSYWVQRVIRLAEVQGARLAHPVVLMHNQPIGNPATVSALPVIIRLFRSRGYTSVAL